jgi:hypothetical protein
MISGAELPGSMGRKDIFDPFGEQTKALQAKSKLVRFGTFIA